MTAAGEDRACDLGPDGLPTCSTGPFGRLRWTLRQIAEILHLGRRPG